MCSFLARIFVSSNENTCPVVAKWKGIPLSLFKSGKIPDKSPSQDFSCSLILVPNFLLACPIYCLGWLAQGTEYTTWELSHLSFLGLLLNNRFPKVVVFGCKVILLFKHFECKEKLLFKHFGCKARLLFTHFGCKAKLFSKYFGCEARLLFKIFGCEARLLFNHYGCEARLLFNCLWCKERLVFKQLECKDFSSNILGAK